MGSKREAWTRVDIDGGRRYQLELCLFTVSHGDCPEPKDLPELAVLRHIQERDCPSCQIQ